MAVARRGERICISTFPVLSVSVLVSTVFLPDRRFRDPRSSLRLSFLTK